MSVFRTFSITLLCTAVAGRAQVIPAGNTPAPADPVQHMDAFVVSSGPDPKTAFDLAQGSSVLTADELRKAVQGTLGDTLAGTPGVSSSSFGPGSSRPIIRGLGGDRIRVLDNGVGPLDASTVSPDHNTAIEPLFASRIEVLRGPSTLLYGSSAVGGVVNVISNTIPERRFERPTEGAIEVRAGGAADERAAVLSAGGGGGRVAARINALARRTDDVRIPDVARIDADAPVDQVRGTLPDSATKTNAVAAGATWFASAGHLGAGVTRYETTYGVPTDEPGIRIRMDQTRLDLAGEVRAPLGLIRTARTRAGFGDYRHAELGDHGAVTHTTFRNRAAEGRIELSHAPLGAVTGTWGAQAAASDFSAEGEEVVTPASRTRSAALFAVEEYRPVEPLTVQFGARVEGQQIRLGDVPDGLPVVPGYAARSGQKRKFAGASAALGFVYRLRQDWSLAANLTSTERLPTAQELFSNGPHGGTGAYEVGTTALDKERSTGLDLTLRRRNGPITGAVTVFTNRFRNYIFEQRLAEDAIPEENNPEGLVPYQFVARDARFAGGEAEVSFHLIDEPARHLHVDVWSDYVRATQTTDDEPLPRIPPLRYGAKLSYENGRWQADVGFRRARRQTRVASDETATDGYTVLDANVAFFLPRGRVTYEVFLRGRNLTDADAREHASFLKDFAPLPGRGVLFGVRASY